MSDAQGTGQQPNGAGEQQGAEGQQPGGNGAGQGDPGQQQQQQGQGQPGQGDGKGNGGDAALEYKFTAPDGVEFDQERLTEFTTIAKELKLPQDAAQKLVALEVKRVQSAAAAHQKLVEGWAESVKTDKDIGGDKLAENMAIAKKAIDLGPPELKDLLNSTGMGNHPAVVKWALAIGKKLSEDNFVQGERQGANTGNSEQARANRLYPTTAQAS